MNRLQISSFAFLPAAVQSIAGATVGVPLRFAHIFVVPMLALSFVNHSRDYYDGPHFDLVDVTDRLAVTGLTFACVLDSFTIEWWQIIAGGSFALLTLGLFLYSITLKKVVLEGSKAETMSPREWTTNLAVDPEIVHAWMHACAGVSVFAILM